MTEDINTGVESDAPARPEPVAAARRSARRPIAIAAVVAAVVVVVTVVLAVALSGKSTMTVHGKMTIDGSGAITTGSNRCTGSGGYGDIRQGTQVVITDETGTIIATTQLGQGSADGTISVSGPAICVFEFAVDVPTGKKFYGVEVSHRGRVQFTQDDLKKGPDLTLGR